MFRTEVIVDIEAGETVLCEENIVYLLNKTNIKI